MHISAIIDVTFCGRKAKTNDKEAQANEWIWNVALQ